MLAAAVAAADARMSVRPGHPRPALPRTLRTSVTQAGHPRGSPDLSRAGIRDAYPVPGARSAGRAADSVLAEVPDMRIERDGQVRWLVVEVAPQDLWQVLRDFWRAQGFELAVDDPEVGVMETGWAGKSVDLPVGGVRGLFERFKRVAYTYKVRDRFRTRIERSDEDGSIAVYVAHRGAHEVVRGDSYAWEPRPTDPGLEAEMLGRLMHHLGRSESGEDALAPETAGSSVVPRGRSW